MPLEFGAGLFQGTAAANVNSILSKRKYNQPVTGALDGVNTVYTTPNNFTAGSEQVSLGGVLQDTITPNYSVTGANQITFAIPPQADQGPIVVSYNLA